MFIDYVCTVEVTPPPFFLSKMCCQTDCKTAFPHISILFWMLEFLALLYYLCMCKQNDFFSSHLCCCWWIFDYLCLTVSNTAQPLGGSILCWFSCRKFLCAHQKKRSSGFKLKVWCKKKQKEERREQLGHSEVLSAQRINSQGPGWALGGQIHAALTGETQYCCWL